MSPVCEYMEAHGGQQLTLVSSSGAVYHMFLRLVFSYVFVCISLCECVHMKADNHRNQRSPIPMELELQMVVSGSTWVLGNELGSSWK